MTEGARSVDLLVSCQALPTCASWTKLLSDLARQWSRQPQIRLHLRGSGEALEQSLSGLIEATQLCTPYRVKLDADNSGLENVQHLICLERVSE